MITDEQVEAEVQAKGLTAPRVTMDIIQNAIANEVYQRIEGTNVTICVLRLANGYSVTGESASVSDLNFNQELGNKIAKQQALDKCWALFGFHLACHVSGWMPFVNQETN